MFTSSLLLLALVPAIALGLVACAADTGTDEQEDVTEASAAMAAPNKALIGTFRKGPTEVGILNDMVFKTDGTYHRAIPQHCATRWCPPIEDNGRYNLWSYDRVQMVTLYPLGGTPDRYQYLVTGDRLRMARAGDNNWTILWRTEDQAWCNAPADCELQNLPVGICGSQWYCNANVCSYPCKEPGSPE